MLSNAKLWLLALTAVASLLTGCAHPNAGAGAAGSGPSLQIKGSDTMVNLGQAWAEAFGARTGVQVMITGGGSGTGIAALLSGTCDIAESSRKMEDKELAEARKKGITPHEFMVALDGLAVVVNPQNPVDKLTLDQLADIFTGRITNWRELGGPDKEIVLLSREVNSGTHVYFKEHVLGRGKKNAHAEFSDGALLSPSSQAIADEISYNDQAIGYFGMGYRNDKLKLVAIAPAAGEPYADPTPENVVAGKYPISRPLLFYTNGEPTGVLKEYLDFVLSPEGQRLVREQDFVPLAAPADSGGV